MLPATVRVGQPLADRRMRDHGRAQRTGAAKLEQHQRVVFGAGGDGDEDGDEDEDGADRRGHCGRSWRAHVPRRTFRARRVRVVERDAHEGRRRRSTPVIAIQNHRRLVIGRGASTCAGVGTPISEVGRRHLRAGGELGRRRQRRRLGRRPTARAWAPVAAAAASARPASVTAASAGAPPSVAGATWPRAGAASHTTSAAAAHPIQRRRCSQPLPA